jgi:peptide/nickel transport system ATP-binding protein
VRAVDGVSFAIAKGETVGLVGESGCGKTTLARAILGLLPRHAAVTGTIELLGNDISHASAKSRRALLGQHLGYVAQDPYAACDPIRTVRHHIEEAWRAHGAAVPPGVIEQRMSALGIAAAPTRLRDRPYQWSGGMLQRASISAATAHDPELVLADEPTSALDVTVQAEVLELLRELRDSRGMAVLFVSHDLAVIAELCDRVAIMRAGQVVEQGPTGQVIAAPRHDYTRELLAAVPRLGE